ncbi:tripartite motif-containing protein 55 [Pelomyxa schiedti]|nr:tripartite motif-containing protein 55 [Pelomyxa schiedti]
MTAHGNDGVSEWPDFEAIEEEIQEEVAVAEELGSNGKAYSTSSSRQAEHEQEQQHEQKEQEQEQEHEPSQEGIVAAQDDEAEENQYEYEYEYELEDVDVGEDNDHVPRLEGEGEGDGDGDVDGNAEEEEEGEEEEEREGGEEEEEAEEEEVEEEEEEEEQLGELGYDEAPDVEEVLELLDEGAEVGQPAEYEYEYEYEEAAVEPRDSHGDDDAAGTASASTTGAGTEDVAKGTAAPDGAGEDRREEVAIWDPAYGDEEVETWQDFEEEEYGEGAFASSATHATTSGGTDKGEDQVGGEAVRGEDDDGVGVGVGDGDGDGDGVAVHSGGSDDFDSALEADIVNEPLGTATSALHNESSDSEDRMCEICCKPFHLSRFIKECFNSVPVQLTPFTSELKSSIPLPPSNTSLDIESNSRDITTCTAQSSTSASQPISPSHTINDLEDGINGCPICMEKWHAPIFLLPCAHSLCGSCADSILQKSPQCPLCRTLIPAKSTSDLKRNYQLETFCEYVHQSPRPSTKIKPRKSLCSAHKKPLKYYCANSTCRIPVCVDCLLYGEHKSHQAQDLKKAAQDQQPLLKDLYTQLAARKTELRQLQLKLESQISTLQKKKLQTATAANRAERLIYDSLASKFAEMRDELDNAFTSATLQCQRSIRETDEMISLVTCAFPMTGSVPDRTEDDPVSVVSSVQAIIDALETSNLVKQRGSEVSSPDILQMPGVQQPSQKSRNSNSEDIALKVLSTQILTLGSHVINLGDIVKDLLSSTTNKP